MKPWVKVRPSSRFAPITTGTRVNRPAAMAARGSWGRNGVPRTGDGMPGYPASSSAPTGAARMHATAVAGSVQPTAAAIELPVVSASALGLARAGAALQHRLREQAGRARAPTRWTHTENAPADSPPSVTCLGSPPNAAMLRWTQRSAACWSISP